MMAQTFTQAHRPNADWRGVGRREDCHGLRLQRGPPAPAMAENVAAPYTAVMSPRHRRPRRPTTARRAPRALRLARRQLLRSADRTLSTFINGIDWFLRDPADLVDQTPFEVVHRDGKLQIRRYRPLDRLDSWGIGTEIEGSSPAPVPVPVLLIPPLMVRPLIYDLTDGRSYARTLLAAGFDVFLVDFGVPDAADADVSLDDYVLDWMPQAVDTACTISGAGCVSLIGYCQGGLFGLMHASANEDERVRNIVTIGSPIDTEKMGVLIALLRMGHEQIDVLSKHIGNVPGEISSRFFKLMNPLKSMTRYADLFLNMYNQEYVNGFDALSQWTDNFIDYPSDAFRQLMRDFMAGNKLKDGEMRFGDKVADLSRIQCPVLAFAGKSDDIVPPAAVRAVLDVVGSEDTEVRVVPGGHMGVFAGRHAPDEVWKYSARWLIERSA